jgi:hypothetical protein
VHEEHIKEEKRMEKHHIRLANIGDSKKGAVVDDSLKSKCFLCKNELDPETFLKIVKIKKEV